MKYLYLSAKIFLLIATIYSAWNVGRFALKQRNERIELERQEHARMEDLQLMNIAYMQAAAMPDQELGLRLAKEALDTFHKKHPEIEKEKAAHREKTWTMHSYPQVIGYMEKSDIGWPPKDPPPKGYEWGKNPKDAEVLLAKPHIILGHKRGHCLVADDEFFYLSDVSMDKVTVNGVQMKEVIVMMKYLNDPMVNVHPKHVAALLKRLEGNK